MRIFCCRPLFVVVVVVVVVVFIQLHAVSGAHSACELVYVVDSLESSNDTALNMVASLASLSSDSSSLYQSMLVFLSFVGVACVLQIIIAIIVRPGVCRCKWKKWKRVRALLRR